MAVETETVPYALPRGKAQDDIEKFCTKWADVLSDTDALPQPMRAIAEFVKREGEGGRG